MIVEIVSDEEFDFIEAAERAALERKRDIVLVVEVDSLKWAFANELPYLWHSVDENPYVPPENHVIARVYRIRRDSVPDAQRDRVEDHPVPIPDGKENQDPGLD